MKHIKNNDILMTEIYRKRIFAYVLSFIFVIISFLIIIKPEVSEAARITADLVFKGGKIYTMDAARTWADTLVIAKSRIVYVGPPGGEKTFIGPQSRILDLKGKMVLPGFHDSHTHPILGGIELEMCNLKGIEKENAVYKKIEDYVKRHPEKKWIKGCGWDPPAFPGKDPSKTELDKLIYNRPAFFTSADGHSAWVNSKALFIAGIDKKTNDPPNGRIEKDPKTGEPTGILREDAVELVEKHFPKVSGKENIIALKRALKLANSFGITSLQEADADDEKLRAYKFLDELDQLTARVAISLKIDNENAEKQLNSLLSKRKHYRGKRIKADSIKIFEDGVIESHTAALLEPYSDREGYSGKLIMEPSRLNNIVNVFDKAKFQIHVHAIGDRAIRTMLDAFENARKSNGIWDSRHQIAHLEIINRDDINRFRNLGVIANFQPLWAFPDSYITEMTAPLLGEERMKMLYPIGSIFRSGAIIAAGSDWNVSSMNPLEAIEVALTRRKPGDASGPSLIPDEAIDLPSAIAAYTINGAYLCREERKTGSIEVGKAADIIVIDKNLFALKKEDIHKAKVLLTLLEGREIFRDKSFPFANSKYR